MPNLLGYAPDIDPTTEGVIVDCQNFIPSLRGMRAAPSPVASGVPALPSAVTGAIAAMRLDNTVKTYYGTATDIYEYRENVHIVQALASVYYNGVVSGFTLVDKGSGYTSEPTVKIIGANAAGIGSGAGAAATANFNATISSIKVTNQGQGYLSTPDVYIEGGGGAGAKATAVIGATPDGGMIAKLLNGGSGYISAPKVVLTGGNGSGAAAACSVANGRVMSLWFESVGIGYTTPPTISFAGGGGSGASADALIARVGVNKISVTSQGIGYTSAPTIVIVGGNTGGEAVLRLNRVTVSNGLFYYPSCDVVAGGSGYLTEPYVWVMDEAAVVGVSPAVLKITCTVNNGSIVSASVSGSATTKNSPTRAMLSALVDNWTVFQNTDPAKSFIGATAVAERNGFIDSITLKNQGSGYMSAPIVEITGGGGSGAKATAQIKSSISFIDLLDGGYGYTKPATVKITGTGGSGATATVTVDTAAMTVSGISLTNGGSGYGEDTQVEISKPDLNSLFSVGRKSAPYSSTARWCFTQFGDATIASNGTDPIQQSINDSDFADIKGAPAAKIVESVAGFVFAFNTADSVYGVRPDGWWCCAIYDQTNWTPSQATQAANGRIIDTPGQIRAGKALGPDIVVYKDNSMFYGSYQGPPMIWAFRSISTQIGAPCQEAVVSIGTAHIIMGNDNFYMFDGTRPVPIGDGFKKWFLNDRDPAHKTKATSVHDHSNSLIYFYYVSKSGGGLIDRCLVYNYKTNRWGRADMKIECAVGFSDGAASWNSLGALAKTWADLPQVSYDSDYWTASEATPSVVDTSHTVQLMVGSPKQSSLTTGDFGDDEQYTLLQQVRIRASSEPSSATMTAEHRTTLGAQPNTSTASDYIDGKFDVDVSDRWHRCIFKFNGDVELIGYTPKLVQDGLA